MKKVHKIAHNSPKRLPCSVHRGFSKKKKIITEDKLFCFFSNKVHFLNIPEFNFKSHQCQLPAYSSLQLLQDPTYCIPLSLHPSVAYIRTSSLVERTTFKFIPKGGPATPQILVSFTPEMINHHMGMFPV